MVGITIILVSGFALDWLSTTYPADMPFLAPFEFSWPEFFAAALALYGYFRGIRQTPAHLRPKPIKRCCFLAGVLSIYAVLQTHFDYMAQHMFLLTRVQHLVTHHLGPFLIALAWPDAFYVFKTGRLRAFKLASARVIDIVQQPLIAGSVFVGLIFLWLIPSVQFAAMIDRRLYALMNFSMVFDGILFWWVVFDQRPVRHGGLPRVIRLVLVFAVQLPQIIGGAFISFIGHPLYPYYQLCGRVFPSISDSLDQQLGGFVILYGGGMMSVAAALILVRAMWREEQEAHAVLQAALHRVR